MMTELVAIACLLSAGDVQDKPTGTLSLYNGRNLEGWYTFSKHRGCGTDPRGVLAG